MCTIREMLGNDEKVWVYINNSDTWDKFVKLAKKEGFGFGNLTYEMWNFGHIISINRSDDMGHLPLFVWCNSFLYDIKCLPKKIDFLKYYNNKVFICKDSHFTSNLS